MDENIETNIFLNIIKYIKNEFIAKLFIVFSIIMITIIIYVFFAKDTAVIKIGVIIGAGVTIVFIADSYKSKNDIKKCPYDKDGVCILVDSLDKKNQQKIAHEIEAVFRNRFANGNLKITPIPLSYEEVLKCSSFTDDQILNKTRCKILVRVDDIENKGKHKDFFSVYCQSMKKLNSSVCPTLFKHEIDFNSTNLLENIKKEIEGIAIISEYVISYIYCGYKNYISSSEILDDLKENLKNKGLSRYSKLLNKIDYILYKENIILAFAFYNDYKSTLTPSLLVKSEYYLNKANNIYMNTFHYHILNIKIQFIKHRNVNYGIKWLSYKRRNSKYSIERKIYLAFLLSYNNDHEYKIINLYKEAFKLINNDTTINKKQYIEEVINFINDFVKPEEYKNSKLYLSLAILYIEIGKKREFKKYINLYVNTNKNNLIDTSIETLENIYNIKLNGLIKLSK